jgi:hypothetical protein
VEGNINRVNLNQASDVRQVQIRSAAQTCAASGLMEPMWVMSEQHEHVRQ